MTPLGRGELPGAEYDCDTWYVIGEETIDGREYWLVYECYTEKLGFILKEKMFEPAG